MSAGLANVDDHGKLRAQLAEELPRTENGLWQLFPDGRMETTWRIRSDALWQDGTPFTTRDLLFTDNRPKLTLRLGLRYVRGLREEAGRALVRARNVAPLDSIHDLTHHVPELRKDELSTLAEIGALNSIGHLPRRHEGAKAGVTSGSRVRLSASPHVESPPVQCLSRGGAVR